MVVGLKLVQLLVVKGVMESGFLLAIVQDLLKLRLSLVQIHQLARIVGHMDRLERALLLVELGLRQELLQDA